MAPVQDLAGPSAIDDLSAQTFSFIKPLCSTGIGAARNHADALVKAAMDASGKPI
jgi:hypothetical protein